MANVSATSDYITGNWTNQLGSNVTFKCSDGIITGTYNTAVVSNKNKNEIPPPTPLYGTYQNVLDGILLTFAVQWKFQNFKTGEYVYSTTTWNGKFYLSDLNNFKTLWILRSNTNKLEEWSGFMVNQDIFTRVTNLIN